MRQITLDLNAESSRPILSLYVFQALLDSGADIPVCCLPLNILKKQFHANLVIKDCVFYSFGHEVHGDVYCLEMLWLGDLLYQNIHVFVVPESVFIHNGKQSPLFYFILSSSMFTGLIYEIDDQNHKLNITIPDNQSLVRNLVIRREGAHLAVLCGSA